MNEVTWSLLVFRAMYLRITMYKGGTLNMQSVKRYGDEVIRKLNNQKVNYTCSFGKADYENFKRKYKCYFESEGDQIRLNNQISKYLLHSNSSYCTDIVLSAMLDEDVIKKSNILE